MKHYDRSFHALMPSYDDTMLRNASRNDMKRGGILNEKVGNSI